MTLTNYLAVISPLSRSQIHEGSLLRRRHSFRHFFSNSSGHKVQIDPSLYSSVKIYPRPTSSRSEYIPTQSEYRLAQKEIAADVMHTLGKLQTQLFEKTIKQYMSVFYLLSELSFQMEHRQ